MNHFPIPVNIKLSHPNAKVPTKNNESDMGYDFYCIPDEDFHGEYLGDPDKNAFRLYPKTSHVFHTGVHLSIPDNYGLLLWDRSGMGAKRNIHRLAGVIDAGYRGEIMVCLVNLSKESQLIKTGDKIIQGIFQQRIGVMWNLVDELDDSIRGEKGFGSSGA